MFIILAFFWVLSAVYAHAYADVCVCVSVCKIFVKEIGYTLFETILFNTRSMLCKIHRYEFIYTLIFIVSWNHLNGRCFFYLCWKTE